MWGWIWIDGHIHPFTQTFIHCFYMQHLFLPQIIQKGTVDPSRAISGVQCFADWTFQFIILRYIANQFKYHYTLLHRIKEMLLFKDEKDNNQYSVLYNIYYYTHERQNMTILLIPTLRFLLVFCSLFLFLSFPLFIYFIGQLDDNTTWDIMSGFGFSWWRIKDKDTTKRGMLYYYVWCTYMYVYLLTL